MKHAFRSLRKSPGFAVTALATLALCLGANLTIFAVIDAILIRSLPYPDADRLVTLYYKYPKLASASSGASLTNYYERRGQIPAFSNLAEIGYATSVVGETGATSIESLGRVSPEFFTTLGIQPFMGRAFSDVEMTYQTDHVAMISYEYWRAHFNSNADVLGKSIRLDGIPRVIVGVLPPHFRFLSFSAPVFMPLSSEEGERNIGARHSLGKIMVARLAPGATLADAQSQIDAHDAAHAAEFPDAPIVADAGCHTVVVPLHVDHVAPVRPLLLLLQAGAVLLLVIGVVNLVNLFLIRASGRMRDLAIRQALGASQRHVIREVMTESMLLTMLGAVLGLGIGAVGLKLVTVLGANQLPLGAEIGFDVRVAGVALVSALMLGGALGAPIAWFNLRARIAVALQSESRGATVSRATRRVRHSFIVAQIALAFVLLAGAGLLGLSLKRMMEVSPGFRPDHILTGQFNLTWLGYHDLNAFHRFFDRLTEKTRSLPGVTAVGAISNVPVTGSLSSGPVRVPGYASASGSSLAIHNFFGVAGDYFAAMGIPLHAGRFLGSADPHSAAKPCVVDENFARRYWPGQSALGQTLYRGTEAAPGEVPYTVVGVVGAVKQSGLNEQNATGAVYFSYSDVFIRNYFLVARTSLPPETLAATFVKIIREIDPDMPLTDLRSMDAVIGDSLATRRSPALLAGIFAGVALLLATIGLYGAMAYSVAQRTVEFGIRMALGAQRSDVLRLVFGQGFRLTVIGLALGLGAALLLTDTLSSLLFNVRANDPLALSAIAALLATVAAIACFLPAFRATKVSPISSLRAE
ncbi:MAG: ABC transporter permease [Opitutus sp.]